MGSVVKGMDKAMESMNLERVSHSLISWAGIMVLYCVQYLSQLGIGCWEVEMVRKAG